MALEDLTGTNKGLAALVVTNPDGLDPKSEGDNHLRGIKNVLINVFGAMAAAVTSLPAVGQALRWDGTKYAPAGTGDVPIGTIIDFAAPIAKIPPGYWYCNGAAVPRTGATAALFAVIGTTWGAGDGSTTFNVPNFNRRVAVGAGGVGTATLGANVGDAGGEEAHALTAAENAAHQHTTPTGGGPTNQADTNAGLDIGIFNAASLTGSSGSGTPHNTMQPSANVLKIIRYQ